MNIPLDLPQHCGHPDDHLDAINLIEELAARMERWASQVQTPNDLHRSLQVASDELFNAARAYNGAFNPE